MKTVFVIKALKKGVWYFYNSLYNDLDRDRAWDTDLYIAKKFDTYPEAEAFLQKKHEDEHWGGFFQIEKYFLSR